MALQAIASDWNGSGMRTNFSSSYMRETLAKVAKLMAKFVFTATVKTPNRPGNDQRLTGTHETPSLSTNSPMALLTVALP